MKKYSILINLLLLFFLFNDCQSQNLKTRIVVSNLDTPWEILWGPDNYIWMTERPGKISRVNPETGEVKQLIKIDEVYENGESGLMGLALHPNFQSTPYVYASYSYRVNGNVKNKIVRYEYNNDNLQNPKVLIDGIDGSSIHNGSRLLFGLDGMLYATFGDASNSSNAQDLNSLNGKILRMTDNGEIPSDNPIQNSYIWTYGHRNPQGLVFIGNQLFSSEHGSSTDDEINIIQKGRNYGWPDVKGFCDTQDEIAFCQEHNVVEPIKAWTPTIAPAGLDFYNNGQISDWDNSLLLVSLKGSRLTQLQLNQERNAILKEKQYFVNNYGRLRDICISPDGRVFIATSNRDGRGNPAQDDDKIIEVSEQGTGIKDGINDNSIQIHQNTSNPYLIEISSIYSQMNIEIFDVLGKIYYSKNLFDSNQFILDLSQVSSINNNHILFIRVYNKLTYRVSKILI